MTGSEKPTEAGDPTGPAETLLRQLELRFGAIPEAAAAWVRGADVASSSGASRESPLPR